MSVVLSNSNDFQCRKIIFSKKLATEWVHEKNNSKSGWRHVWSVQLSHGGVSLSIIIFIRLSDLLYLQGLPFCVPTSFLSTHAKQMLWNSICVFQQGGSAICVLGVLQFTSSLCQSSRSQDGIWWAEQVGVLDRSVQRIKWVHWEVKMLLSLADQNPNGIRDNWLIQTEEQTFKGESANTGKECSLVGQRDVPHQRLNRCGGSWSEREQDINIWYFQRTI